MCSICGIVDFKDGVVKSDIIKEMNCTMKHRGPDESDYFSDRFASFGHNRLSVIDLKNGHQPMSATYGNKKYTIVYNGEIYNCEEITGYRIKQAESFDWCYDFPKIEAEKISDEGCR